MDNKPKSKFRLVQREPMESDEQLVNENVYMPADKIYQRSRVMQMTDDDRPDLKLRQEAMDEVLPPKIESAPIRLDGIPNDIEPFKEIWNIYTKTLVVMLTVFDLALWLCSFQPLHVIASNWRTIGLASIFLNIGCMLVCLVQLFKGHRNDMPALIRISTNQLKLFMLMTFITVSFILLGYYSNKIAMEKNVRENPPNKAFNWLYEKVIPKSTIQDD